jgi:LSD1 subclass zinc finger protein
MSVVHQLCPSCSAPLDNPTGATKFKCPFCGTALAIQGQGSDSTLATTIEKSGTQTQDAISAGSLVTQTELRRLQLSQDLSMVQMRLANVQSEIRAIERVPATSITRKQLGELRTTEAELRRQIKTLSDTLNPPAAVTSPVSAPKRSITNSATANNLIWTLFSFSGRLERGGYWLGIVIALALFWVSSGLATVSGAAESNEPSAPLSCLFIIASVLFIWIGIAVSIKRYHDRGKPGIWVLIIFIPVIGIVWQFVELGLFPGDPSPNRYG